MKRRFAVVILVVVGICIFFMVTVVNQRYSGIEAVTMLQEKESSDSQSMQQKESLAFSSSQQKESSSLASSNSAAESIAEVPEDMHQNVSKLKSTIKDRKDIPDFIHKQCNKYGKLTVKLGEAKRPRKMVIPKNWKEHKLIYASNPKTGSSSFKKWVSKMQGNTNPYSQIKHVHLMWKYGNVQKLFEDATQRLGHEA